jgi:hypothetical protein
MAASHLSWLLSHDYAPGAAVKLVGDHFRLDARQRLAVQRSACSDASRDERRERTLSQVEIRGHDLDIDGLNLLTTVEAALAGGVLLRGRDGFLRDMASVHGSYRKVEETLPALQAIGEVIEKLHPARCTWWLDRPVSNSGRVSKMILELAESRHWIWQTQLVPDPDAVLRHSPAVVVTADSVILDSAPRIFDLASLVVDRVCDRPWIVPFAHDRVG